MGFLRIFWEVKNGVMFSPPIVNDIIVGKGSSLGDLNNKVADNHALISAEGDNFFIEEINGSVFSNGNRIRGRISLNDLDNVTLNSDKGEVELGLVIENGLGKKISNTKNVYRFLANTYNFSNCKGLSNVWYFFDRSYLGRFNNQFADETKAERDIYNGREFREKEKLRNFFKIYFYFNKAYLFSSFEKVLKAIEESGVKKIGGKIIMVDRAFNPDDPGSYNAGKIVLYVIGESEKNLLLSHFKTIRFDSRAYLPNEPVFVKRLNNFIVWNQGGHSIRKAVRDKKYLNYYFSGRNFELIKEERLE